MPLDIDLRKGCRRDAATFFCSKNTQHSNRSLKWQPFTKTIGFRRETALCCRHEVRHRRFGMERTDYRSPAARCGKNPQGGGMRRAEYHHQTVPGTFELPLGAQFFAEYTDVDGVIALGCVIQGETRHFDYVCMGVTQGITQLMLSWSMPVAFGVLTTENLQQAFDRAGGKYGNKGDEAAQQQQSKMVALQQEMGTGG